MIGTFRRIGWRTLLLCAVLSGCASPDIQTRRVVNEMRSTISLSGSAELKEQNLKVELIVLHRNMPYAGLYLPLGRPVIVFTSGWYEMATYFAEAEIAERSRDINARDCREKYVVDIRDRVLEVIKSRGRLFNIFEGRDPNVLESPAKYFSENLVSECGFLTKLLPLKPADHPARDEAIADVIKLVYLHELAHLTTLGDNRPVKIDRLKKIQHSEKLAEMKRSRKIEYAADKWSVEQFMKLTNNPTRVLKHHLLADLHIALGFRPCKIERWVTHPSGDRRAAAMYKRLRELAIESNTYNLDQATSTELSRFMSEVDSRVHAEGCFGR